VPGVYTENPSFLSPARVPDGFRVDAEGNGNGSSRKALINVGSVGQPRDGDTRASYVTWDGSTVWFHRVEYDYRRTQQKILDTGALPRYLAARLQEGR
jgi:diadenosine tetraphosphatase ApaH/serine/threonine PP2A family protein phosphatase